MPCLFSNKYDPYDYFPYNTKNNIQQLIFSLGSEYSFLPRFAANLSFGYGIYRESFHIIKDPEATSKFYGMTITAHIGLKYQMFRR